MSDEIKVGRRRVRLTHPDRVLFPDDGVTKGDLAEYYAQIGRRPVEERDVTVAEVVEFICTNRAPAPAPAPVAGA